MPGSIGTPSPRLPARRWILLSAGEVSGDRAAARVARVLRERAPELQLEGLGGPAMATAGVALRAETLQLGAVGVSEALRILPAHLGVGRRLLRELRDDPPEAALLVGNDLFHVLLGRWLRKRGIPTFSYFPPQVWLWGAVARWFGRSFDLVLTSFPDEETVYSRAGCPTRFVGHYLAGVLAPPSPSRRAELRSELGVESADPLLAVLPGSRDQEVFAFAPLLLGAVRRLADEYPRLAALLPVADASFEPFLRRAVAEEGLTDRVYLVAPSHDALAASELVLATSGTATLEAALLEVPTVVIYRISGLSRFTVGLAHRLGLVAQEVVALPNLLLHRPVVPELKQRRANAEEVAREARALLHDPELRRRTQAALAAIRPLLDAGTDPAVAVAGAVLERLRSDPCPQATPRRAPLEEVFP